MRKTYRDKRPNPSKEPTDNRHKLLDRLHDLFPLPSNRKFVHEESCATQIPGTVLRTCNCNVKLIVSTSEKDHIYQ